MPALPPPPALPDSRWVYRAIMARVEPDLLPENAARLDAKYRDEQPEQTRARAARYAAAVAAFERQYAAYRGWATDQVRRYQRGSVGGLETADRHREADDLARIETQLL